MRSADIYWETSPLFRVSKTVGIAPYNKYFRLSKIHTPLTILCLSLILSDALYVGACMEKVNDSFQLSGFSLILERFQLLMVIVTVVVCMTKSIKNVKLIRSVMENLASVDDYLSKMQLDEKLQRCSLYTSLIVRFFNLSSLIILDCVISKMYRKLDSILVECILMYPLIVNNTVESQFIVLLNSAKKRLIIVTDEIKDMCRKKKNVINIESLEVLSTVHGMLVDICQDMNSLYSHQILMIFSGIFILITSNLYHVVEKLIVFASTKNSKQLNFATITSYRVMVRAYEVWTVVTTCSETTEKAKQFNTQLYQLMIDDRTDKISNNKILRLHITMKRDILFTACGFFTLDYTLVHSMIAAATTYLVILIQFGQPQDVPSGGQNNLTNTAIIITNLTISSLSTTFPILSSTSLPY